MAQCKISLETELYIQTCQSCIPKVAETRGWSLFVEAARLKTSITTFSQHGLLLAQNTFYTSSSKHVLKTAVLVEPLSKHLRGLVVKYLNDSSAHCGFCCTRCS